MQDKITRRSVGSLQHTLSAIGLCQILPHGAHPHADRGVRPFPADLPFIHHRTVGFVSSLPWCYPGIMLPGSGIGVAFFTCDWPMTSILPILRERHAWVKKLRVVKA